MLDNELFVFGSKLFCDVKKDPLSSLPLELSWKIFSYLDDMSLRTACQVYKIWQRIILSCKKLRNRLNKFELVIKLGSEHLARFYRKSIKRMKKEKKKRFKEVFKVEEPTAVSTMVHKRKGDSLTIYAKRYKLH